jgi:hypothetical protein
MMADLRELTDRIGGRISGTPACERAIDWAGAKLRSTGADSVTLEPFTMPSAWIPKGIEGSCIEPAAFPLRLAAAPGTAGTPGGRAVEARVVDAAEGTPEAFAKLGDSARGQIALVRNPEMKSLEDLFAEYMKAAALLEAAHKAGVAAVLLESSRPRVLLYRHPMTFDGSVDSMPVAVVARESAAHAAPAGEGAGARAARDRQRRSDPCVMKNVVAEIRGSDRREEIVLVGAHLDAFDLEPGPRQRRVVRGGHRSRAADQGCGSDPPPHDRFLLFTGEEQGMLGSGPTCARTPPSSTGTSPP